MTNQEVYDYLSENLDDHAERIAHFLEFEDKSLAHQLCQAIKRIKERPEFKEYLRRNKKYLDNKNQHLNK